MTPAKHRAAIAVLTMMVLVHGCGDDVPRLDERPPMPTVTPPAGQGPDTKAGAAGGAVAEGGDEPIAEGEVLKRPPVKLDARSFQRRRDPFQSLVASQKIDLLPDRPRAQRKVVLAEYAFEDLRLVAIVNGGRSIVPRALFVGSDGRSKSVEQGSHFSSAEVLLASVNRDYVEIEIVDEALASSLNMQRGERRAIYLRND